MSSKYETLMLWLMALLLFLGFAWSLNLSLFNWWASSGPPVQASRNLQNAWERLLWDFWRAASGFRNHPTELDSTQEETSVIEPPLGDFIHDMVNEFNERRFNVKHVDMLEFWPTTNVCNSLLHQIAKNRS